MGAALATSGSSGTPLATKLGLKDGMQAAFVALPPSLDVLVRSADFARVERLDDWRSVSSRERPLDIVHAFTKSRAEIEDYLSALRSAIRRDGMIWVSWPKKASKVPTDVTEDVVRDAALKLDLVDVKVAAIDDIWSGLKLVIRKERRDHG
jgi:hypothetical protein